MRYGLFLQPLLLSFLLSAVFLFVFTKIGLRTMKKDVRNQDRHIHQKGISRLGGTAAIAAFVITLLLDPPLVMDKPLAGVLVASVLIIFFGLWDDSKELGWKTQLFFQIAIVAFIHSMGVRLGYVTDPLGGIMPLDGIVGFLIVTVWIVFMMNAMNWVDGVDGVSGSVTLIGAGAIFLLSLRPEVNQPPIGIISAALVGSLLAFEIFNFHPAKILAGTGGSMFMGFILAVLAIFAGAKIATTLLVMAVPVIDALWVIMERLRSGSSVFSPDRRHLHFKLLELGWSQRQVYSFYCVVTLVIAAISLNTRAMGKATAFALVAIIMVVVLLLIGSDKNAKKVLAEK